MKLKPTIKNVHTINCISRNSLSQDSCILPIHIPNRSPHVHYAGNFPGITLYAPIIMPA